MVGAGGTGGYYGGALARAGNQVTMVARGPHLAAIKANGLQVNSVLLGDFHLDVDATDDMSSVGPADLVIFAVKSYGTDDAIRDMGPLVGDETMVISTQNGIDSERLLGEECQCRIVVHFGAATLLMKDPTVAMIRVFAETDVTDQ